MIFFKRVEKVKNFISMLKKFIHHHEVLDYHAVVDDEIKFYIPWAISNFSCPFIIINNYF